jgi:hypothetical protein
MLFGIGNEWILDQSNEFIVFYSYKSQNLKQMMNSIYSLFHASKFEGMLLLSIGVNHNICIF